MSDSARQLRAAGIRATAPRLAVLDALLESAGTEATAEELFLRLRQSYARPSLASVYKALAELAAGGLVSRRRIGQARSHYVASQTTPSHAEESP